jgi:hypothetical protein
MTMKIRTLIGATLLASCLWFQACTPPAWFVTAEGIAEAAVPIAGSIVDIVDPALAPAVTIVENAFSALDNAIKTYQAQPTATGLQAVEAAFTAVQTNESQLEAAAQIKNTAKDTEINGVIQLIATAVTEIAALIPPNAPVSASLLATSAQAKSQAKGLSKYDLEKQFNSLVKNDARFKGKTIHIPLLHRL